MLKKICVAGAGTMGSGIALASAQGGFEVLLYDSNPSIILKAQEGIQKNLHALLEKGKLTDYEKTAITDLITYTSNSSDCKAELIIEAIIEDTEAKLSLFMQLAEINAADCILVSNTSSLSVSKLQASIPHPERFAGMHFFNPAHLMKLVEVVKADKTSDNTINTLMDVCTRLKKKAVLCKDAPGFIVNRVARHYYLEAMKLAEQNIAGIEAIDEIMEASGFRMGPFRLMDLIGMDINLAVSQSLYEAFDKEVRFEPSALQIGKVKKAELGRKTGKGFYNYS